MTERTLARACRLLLVLLLGACTPGSPINPLAAAARNGDLAEIDRLVAAGSNVNEPSGRNDWPPLIHAVHKGKRPALTRLLERGASLEGDVGRKALFMASGYGDAETVALLLSRGAPMPGQRHRGR